MNQKSSLLNYKTFVSRALMADKAGFYGLSTAGNVILFVLIGVIVMPLTWWFNRKEVDL